MDSPLSLTLCNNNDGDDGDDDDDDEMHNAGVTDCESYLNRGVLSVLTCDNS
jgi:hypothetical protein